MAWKKGIALYVAVTMVLWVALPPIAHLIRLVSP